MGFEVFVAWFQDTEPVAMDLDAVHRVFGAAARPVEGDGFEVRYAPGFESRIFAHREPSGMVSSIAVDRPCGAPELWASIVAAMNLGNGLCFWPGDACAVASAAALKHVPKDMQKEVGEPKVVEDGASLLRLIEES